MKALYKLAQLFYKLCNYVGPYDWLKKILYKFKNDIKDTNALNTLFARIEDAKKIDEYTGFKNYNDYKTWYENGLKKLIYPIIKDLMRQKKYDKALQLRKAISKLNINYHTNKVKTESKHEFAKPLEGFFYHGTDATDAISALKTGTFHKSSAFTNLSLTSDLSIATKFGNIIFVFDAKKMQRAGAKKMKYISDDDYVKRVNEGEEAEHYSNPFINNIYKREQEWVLELPVSFYNFLVKMIIIDNGQYKQEEINNILKKISENTSTPVEIIAEQSYFLPSLSKQFKPQEAEIKAFMYDGVIKYLNELILEAQTILNEKLKELISFFNSPEEARRYISRTNEGQFYFLVKKIISNFRDKNYWASVDNINDIMNVQKDIEILSRFNINTKISNLLYLINKSLNEAPYKYKETYLKTDEDYANLILQYRGQNLKPLENELIKWADNNISQFVNLVLNNKYFNTQHTSGVFTILENMKNIDKIPDSFWRKYPDRLIYHPMLWKFDKNRIKNIMSNNSQIYYLEDSLKGWILERAGQSRNNILEIIKILENEKEPAAI